MTSCVVDHIKDWYYVFNTCWYIITSLATIPAGCGTRATSPPTITPRAAGKPPEQGSGPWLDRVAIRGVKYWHYQRQTLSSLTCKKKKCCLCFCSRGSTATPSILCREEETASLTSLMWKHRKTHSVGTDILDTNRVHGKSDINTMACRLICSDASNIKQL